MRRSRAASIQISISVSSSLVYASAPWYRAAVEELVDQVHRQNRVQVRSLFGATSTSQSIRIVRTLAFNCGW